MNEERDKLIDDAVVRAGGLLERRLQRGGINSNRTDWYFQCEGTAPKAFPGGRQVRVKTWRHWSDADVFIDVDRAEVVSRCIDRFAEPAGEAEISEGEAVRIISGSISIPENAVPSKFSHEYFSEGCKLARMEWRHWRDGMRVDGDYLWALVHPEAKRVVGFGKKWRSADVRR
ncbi:MAG: hypothetical protein ACYTHJ_04050 [Planctomycetota bacterium]|jgi:hypothetical protein